MMPQKNRGVQRNAGLKILSLNTMCRLILMVESKTLMWITGRSIEQFKCFGDAVTFDTTCKTNLYDMPFGLFVGVNNHFQSIIFGGVLMNDEKIDTFNWIFTEFFQMVGAPRPRTILTCI
uniref:MULE transposase domain-containing protein n=1 Tax=Aegilops tauschii subsp. strangulata TaxID=200361 RepID=A0A452XL56_AEGTS